MLQLRAERLAGRRQDLGASSEEERNDLDSVNMHYHMSYHETEDSQGLEDWSSSNVQDTPEELEAATELDSE